MKKKRKQRKRVIIISAALFVVLIVGIYLGVMTLYTNKFLPNTYINDIDVANMTVEEVNTMLSDEVTDYTLVIIDSEGNKEYILSSDYSLTYLSDNQVQEVKNKQNNFAWLGSLFGTDKNTVILESAYDKSQLTDRISNLNIIKNAATVAAQNAYITEIDDKYEIVPETLGSYLDIDRIYEVIYTAIEEHKSEIQLEDYTIYETPKITSDNTDLAKEMEFKNALTDLTITYQFDSEERVLTGNTIKNWITYDENFNITVDRTSAYNYVEQLAMEFNTFGGTRTFKTSDGRTINIKGGEYGWIISKDSETDALIELIQNLETTTKEPAYDSEAATHDGIDTGNPDTYVEIDLTAQHLWYYINGSLAVESDIVSGMRDRSPTQEGTYQVSFKKEKWQLVGETYDVVVDYFIMFYTDVGLHDAAWQSSFGGNVYVANGSHGCINMPFDKVAEIYDLIEIGTIVYTYY